MIRRLAPPPPIQRTPAPAQATSEAPKIKSHQLAVKGVNPNELAERIHERQRLQIEKDNGVILEMIPITDNHRRKYPESEFRKNFLPVMSGEAYKKLPEGYTAERLSSEAKHYWMLVAGSPTAEVDIVEPDGKVAFVIPAMADTSQLNIHQPRHEQEGLHQLQRAYREKAAGFPEHAREMLDIGLNHKMKHLTQGRSLDEKPAMDKLEKMREYYNLPKAESSNTNEGSASKPNDFMGEMEF